MRRLAKVYVLLKKESASPGFLAGMSETDPDFFSDSELVFFETGYKI